MLRPGGLISGCRPVFRWRGQSDRWANVRGAMPTRPCARTFAPRLFFPSDSRQSAGCPRPATRRIECSSSAGREAYISNVAPLCRDHNLGACAALRLLVDLWSSNALSSLRLIMGSGVPAPRPLFFTRLVPRWQTLCASTFKARMLCNTRPRTVASQWRARSSPSGTQGLTPAR